ncbi:MAG: peptidoglycan DD-metalloendopeptidase family protein [Anaerolineae bacterium]
MTSIPHAVPKPASAGSPRYAIANTRMAFANIRSGPGTRFRDTADLRNHTLAAYYPATRTSDGWVWIEQNDLAGWVSTQVVNFEDVQTTPAENPTPFDGQIGLWHQRGASLQYSTVSDFADAIKQQAPNVNLIFVQVCDWTAAAGVQWLGYWDTRRGLSIANGSAIDAWIDALGEHDLGFCAWAVPRGGDPEGEAALIANAVKRQGVKALILDLNPRRAIWSAEPQRIDRFITHLRERVDLALHIGLSFDASHTPIATQWLDAWMPLCQSFHPKVLWAAARRPPAEALNRAFARLAPYGKPIFPVLQGDANALDIREAQTLAVFHHQARGISWWRTGTLHLGGWNTIREHSFQPGAPKTPTRLISFADDVIVKPGDADFDLHTSEDRSPKAYSHSWGWQNLAVESEPLIAHARAIWSPRLTVHGSYEISAWIPMRHAAIEDAQYVIKTGRTGENDVTVWVDQAEQHSQWVPLAVLELDPAVSGSGQVVLSNLSEHGGEVALDAIRWRRVVEGAPIHISDGYDMPVGTPTERKSRKVWGGDWTNTAAFGKLAFLGTQDESFHTGADLTPPAGIDAPIPVYAASSGVVSFAAVLPGWGGVVVIRHDPLETDHLVLYGRYGLMRNIRVKVGERVKRGQRIAEIGGGIHQEPPVLHFDLSPSAVLSHNPGHWPRRDRDQVFKHYLDPREFIEANRPV